MTTLATSMATSDRSPQTTDADLRAALLSQLARGRRQQYIVEEMGIAGEARVDVALIGDHLHGFEIKSERDSLRRLPAQVEVYSRVFDYVTLVVDTRHLDGARRIIPDWWGVTEARSTRSGMRLVRRSQARRNRTLDPWYLTNLLWRDEALEVLASLGLDRGMRSKNGTQLRRALVEQASTNALRDAVRSRLQLRRDWRPAAQ